LLKSEQLAGLINGDSNYKVEDASAPGSNPDLLGEIMDGHSGFEQARHRFTLPSGLDLAEG